MSQRIPGQKLREHKSPRSEYAQKLVAHRGMATWGDRLVPLSDFRQAVRGYGTELGEVERGSAVENHRAPRLDGIMVEGPHSKVAVFGGVYSNHFALRALLEQVAKSDCEAVYCLGDLGGFGPSPEKVWSLLLEGNVHSIQGNYEESLSSGRDDCNCGYADPRDNHFAEISYRYTSRNCSEEFKRFMGSLPKRRRVRLGDLELLLIHGSPRRINEFMFWSTTPVAFLEVLLDQEQCDGILCTHTGLHWHRRLPSGRHVINVGVIGRPANDGRTDVWYAILSEKEGQLGIDFRSLTYDHLSLVEEMRLERLPEEFIETIISGWWTTCLEILPARERAFSRW